MLQEPCEPSLRTITKFAQLCENIKQRKWIYKSRPEIRRQLGNQETCTMRRL
jgi:hypothetical protein